MAEETKTELKPWGIWPVRTYVLDAIEAHGWTHDEFKSKLSARFPKVAGLRYHAVMNIEPLVEVPGAAQALARAFGTSDTLWLNLDAAFWTALHSGDYYLAKDDPHDALSPST